jgi:hypothetical protein
MFCLWEHIRIQKKELQKMNLEKCDKLIFAQSLCQSFDSDFSLCDLKLLQNDAEVLLLHRT